MTIRIALHHKTYYHFDRLVGIAPHEIRLRPAPHCRTPILSYSLHIAPDKHFVNWQQDAYGNYIARLVFPDKARELNVTVDLVADMTVINPFDFFVEPYAEKFPFEYPAQLAAELAPYLEKETPGLLLQAWLNRFRAGGYVAGGDIVDFLVLINQKLQGEVRYLMRREPGVQAPDETLGLGSGSCRDSGWLLVQILRHLGLAARFVSGYLIQLTADVKSIDGPAGPNKDFTDLHAWAEVYLPGAGWVGLDPTSGLMAGEGHIPLACTAFPSSAAPISGTTDVCETTFDVSMSVMRIHEDPRVTKPYTEVQWAAIEAVGQQVDAELKAQDVRLTQGGEPTFLSIDDMEGAEWNYTALSEKKWQLAEALAWRLKTLHAPGGVMFYGQGKWYPGEPLPRWALGMYWRADGKAVWRDTTLIAREDAGREISLVEAELFVAALADALGFSPRYVIAAFEDPLSAIQLEANLPVNLDPLAVPMKDYDERSRLAKLLDRGLDQAAGFVLPLQALESAGANTADTHWDSSRWPLKRERLYLLPGDSPLGYRLPLGSLPERLPEDIEPEFDRDPFDERGELHDAQDIATNKPTASALHKDSP
ncbi:MAG: transglutaminase family protein, partial [Burkholderiales bacterium]